MCDKRTTDVSPKLWVPVRVPLLAQLSTSCAGQTAPASGSAHAAVASREGSRQPALSTAASALQRPAPQQPPHHPREHAADGAPPGPKRCKCCRRPSPHTDCKLCVKRQKYFKGELEARAPGLEAALIGIGVSTPLRAIVAAMLPTRDQWEPLWPPMGMPKSTERAERERTKARLFQHCIGAARGLPHAAAVVDRFCPPAAQAAGVPGASGPAPVNAPPAAAAAAAAAQHDELCEACQAVPRAAGSTRCGSCNDLVTHIEDSLGESARRQLFPDGRFPKAWLQTSEYRRHCQSASARDTDTLARVALGLDVYRQWCQLRDAGEGAGRGGSTRTLLRPIRRVDYTDPAVTEPGSAVAARRPRPASADACKQCGVRERVHSAPYCNPCKSAATRVTKHVPVEQCEALFGMGVMEFLRSDEAATAEFVALTTPSGPGHEKLGVKETLPALLRDRFDAWQELDDRERGNKRKRDHQGAVLPASRRQCGSADAERPQAQERERLRLQFAAQADRAPGHDVLAAAAGQQQQQQANALAAAAEGDDDAVHDIFMAGLAGGRPRVAEVKDEAQVQLQAFVGTETSKQFCDAISLMDSDEE